MGYRARLNLRSREGGKPTKFVALHRVWRAVSVFGADRRGFLDYMDRQQLNETQRAAMEKMWAEQHPQPLVTLETQMPA